MIFVSTVAAATVAPSRTIRADDTGTLPNGAVLEWPRLFLADTNGDLVEPPDSDTLRQHLNLGSCLCSQASSATDTDLYYELHLTATTNMNLPAQVFVGSECTDPVQRPNLCHAITTAAIADLDVLSTRADNIRVPLYDMINPSIELDGQACQEANGGSAFVWVVADTDTNGDPDFFSPRPIDLGLFSDVMGFDTKPPPLPDNLTATGSEGSIQLSWDIPDSNATDLYAFQAFCMDASGQPVGGGETPLYSTSDTICGIPATLSLAETAVDGTEGTAVASAPTEFANLDPAYLCGTQPSGTATSLRIEGLDNNAEYTVGLVAVDFYGNPVGTFFNRTVVPKPVTDLWEDIHDRGGKIEGGFCSAGGAGSGALTGVLLPFAMVWLFRRRRSLRRVPVRGATLVGLLVLAPTLARADDFTPYWEDPSTTDVADEFEDHVRWHAGIKLGPYTPDVDSQIGVNAMTGIGPYQAMFGNYYTRESDGSLKAHDAHVYQILPMFDLDRVVWSGSGWLGVGGSIGYMQKTAFAYVDGTSPDDLFRVRSTASSNTFRLIPFALTATYRATQLDDLWGIPLVPYLRGGLAYYIWWLKGPNGNVSKICNDGSDTKGCDGNKAYGGTLGFQATLGVSIRAERVDRDAARGMRQSGIYHAGFYAEVMAAVVNGFGSDTRLSVGDRTWFAGFDFEF